MRKTESMLIGGSLISLLIWFSSCAPANKSSSIKAETSETQLLSAIFMKVERMNQEWFKTTLIFLLFNHK